MLQQPADATRRGHFQIATPPGSKIGPDLTSANGCLLCGERLWAEPAELSAESTNTQQVIGIHVVLRYVIYMYSEAKVGPVFPGAHGALRQRQWADK